MPRRSRPAAVAVLAAIGFVLGAAGALAADVEGRLAPGGAAAVVGIVDGDTVVLDDGRQVRLVGIQAPKLPLGRKGFVAWPLAEAARRAVADLIEGQTVRLAFGGVRMDRHHRVLAHLFREDGLWVQGEMLRRGLARVYTFPDNRALAGAMYAEEGAAQAARAGIWSDPFYAVRRPDGLAREIGTFQVIEGRVLAATRSRERVYLNFGPDWRSDFTVAVAVRDLALFDAAGMTPTSLAGRLLRVRGWLREWNGPMIEATHPEQIELLDGK